MRKKVLKIYLWIFIIGFTYFLWLKFTDIKIPCVYLETTGLKCGGCGITRMFLCMIKFDFVSAFNYNPVAFVLFFIWNAVGILCLTEKVDFVKKKTFHFVLLTITIAIIIFFGVIRNFC